MKKHLIWGITIVLSISILCGTLIYLNHNSWTIRFEMDNNTKDAIQSIDYDALQNNDKCKNRIYFDESSSDWVEHFNETIYPDPDYINEKIRREFDRLNGSDALEVDHE